MEIVPQHSQIGVADGAREDRVGGNPQSSASSSAPPREETLAERVELVRRQNQASPAPALMDLDQALRLLKETWQQLDGLAPGEMRELYQFQRLREVCAQVFQPAPGPEVP